MTGKKRGKKLSTIAVAGAMSVNALMPYSYMQVEAAENTQDHSKPGGTADKILEQKLEEANKKSNKTADQVVEETYKSFAELSAGTNITTTNGIYKIAANTAIKNWTINGDVTVYVPKGTTLSISATSVALETVGNVALKISSGAHLTFVGEGNISIVGGNGGAGRSRTGVKDGSNTKVVGDTGGAGKVGGSAIANSGTFEVSKLFDGNVNIIGGNGGDGGKGQDVAENRFKSTQGFVGGQGGTAGNGAAAITNAGEIIINGDSVTKNISSVGAYGQGNVNIKGGLGGRGGQGGSAGSASVSWSRMGSAMKQNYPGTMKKNWVSLLREDKPNPDDGYFMYWHDTPKEATDVATLYPATAGAAGSTGQGGVGIYGGTLTMNGGLASVEGGNANVSYPAGNSNGAPGYIAGTSLVGVKSKYGLQSIDEWSRNPNYDPNNPVEGVAQFVVKQLEVKNKVSVNTNFNVACVYSAKTTSNVGNFALYGVTVNRNNGTLHAFAGAGVSKAIYSGAQNGTGGTFYAGGYSSDGFSGNQATTTALQLNQLEGMGTADDGTDSNIKNAKNFYVLNEGDTYYDAEGKLQTSKGILVYKNGSPIPTTYGSKDVFVNAQGYVYLSGVSADDKVELQVAIGGKRIGDAGSATKYVTSDTGIYTFKGTVGSGKLNATFASDTSSMDINWLAQQMADDFSGSLTGDQVEIDSPYKLAAFAWAVNHGIDGAANAHVKLTSNIDLKAMYWTPIGTESNPFIGVFDGNGKTIKNMRIQTIQRVNAYGLFGHVKGLQDDKNITSIIKNFTLTNGAYVTYKGAKTVKVNGANSAAYSGGGYNEYATYVVESDEDVFAGSVAGFAENTAFEDIKVENLPMSVNSTNGDVHLGGLVGYDEILKGAQAQNIKDTSVINSGLTATAKKDAYVGGIAGESTDVDFTNVKNDIQNVGTGGKQSTANITVNADNVTYVGGVVGKANSSITGQERGITNADFNDTLGVKRTMTVKGIEGSYVGGIIGDAVDIELRSVSVKVGAIQSESSNKDAYLGGIAGRNDIEKTTYRSIADSNVTFTASTDNLSVTAKGNAYMGGISGYSNHTDSMEATVKNMAPMEVKAETGKAYVGGNIGHAQEAIIGSGIIEITKDIKATGKRGAWASGSLGYGLDASITAQQVTMKGIFADATTESSAYAGGVVGQITNKSTEKKSNAVLSNSQVKFNANGTIQAKSGGLTQPAFAGGILGDAVNVNVYGNSLNDGTAKIAVNAFSEFGTSYAGGMAGRIDNSATSQKINISDTTINNMTISATNATGNEAGYEAYAGGIAGKAIADEVIVMNTTVKGQSNVTAKASLNVFAGRLFGHTVRATILNSAPSANSTVSASSIGGDAYAAGLIGRLDEKIGKAKESAFQSTISMSGVSKTNVTANAGANKTAYAGSLLGDAQNVLLQKSSVNEGVTVTGAQSSVTVTGKDAYVGGIAGRISNPTKDRLAYNSVSATSVKTISSSVTGEVKQAGMYGQINNVFIASSYAKNYLNVHSNTSNSLYGGLFADANNIRMIQSYGTRGNSSQNGIDTTGKDAGLAAKLTGTNQFYGVYSTETKWAYDENGKVIDQTSQGTNNTFKSSYYAGSGNPVTAGNVWGPSSAWGSSNYSRNGDLFDVKEKDASGKYYDSLSAVTFGNSTQKNNVSNAMRNLLHFTTNISDSEELAEISSSQDITTSYEKEVDYRLSYVANQGNTVAGNFNFPTFSEPYFLTLAITPSEEYGKVSETSSITTSGSKKFGKNTTLKFTAIPQDVSEESSFWYEFENWTIQKRSVDANGNVKLENADVKPTTSGTDLTFAMPGYDTVLTANFVQKDNGIRRNINREIYERTISEIERRTQLPKDDPNYLDPKSIDEAALKNVFTEVGTDVLGKYVGSGTDSYRKQIETTYDKIATTPYNAYTTYDSLKDPDRVLQQIAANMADEALSSSEYQYAMEDGMLSLEEIHDVRVDVNDTFTSKGSFKDYVAKQLTVEKSDTAIPSIISTEASKDGHLQGVVSRPFKGEGTSLEYSFIDPTTKEVKWTSAGDGDVGYVVLDSAEAKGADAVYLRNVDKDGFEVITRVPLSRVTSDVVNEKINSDSSNTETGAAGSNDSGQMESILVKDAELLKSSSEIEIAGGETDKGDWYYKTSTSTSTDQQKVIHGLPKPGAYLSSFTVEVNGKTLTIDENTSLSADGKITFEGVEFTVIGDRFEKKDYTAEETISFSAEATVKVTSNYVNLLGEINASNDAITAQRTKEQIAAVIEQEHFKEIFVDSTKDEPNDVTAAKERYDQLSDDEKLIVQEKLALFVPKDAHGNTTGYTRAEFIDVFNAITNIVYVESKLDLNDKGEITALKKNDFTSGTWNNVTDALKLTEDAMTGNFIMNDGSAKDEVQRLLESSTQLEEAVKGLTYKVQTFTLSTNKEQWVDVVADKGKSSPELLKSASLLSDVSTGAFTNIIRFPYQHSDVVVTFDKAALEKAGYTVMLSDDRGNYVLKDDGSVEDNIENVVVEEKDGKLIVTFQDITESKIYKATIQKKQYTISIPEETNISSITNEAYKDRNGNFINLEGTDIQIKDRSEDSEPNYILHLEAEDGYRFNSDATDDNKKASYTYVDKDGNVQTAYVAVDEKGNLSIPNEHLATLENLDLSNVVRELEKQDLESLKSYDEKDYTEASYQAWKNAYDKATSVINDSTATADAINEAYKDVKKAESQLVRQYEITVAPGLMIPEQEGVRELNGKTYVQDGYGVYVQTTDDKTAELKKANKKLNGVSYSEDDKTLNAVLKSDGYSAYLPAITAPVTNVAFTTSDLSINIIEKDMKDDLGNDVSISSELGNEKKEIANTIYHVPDVTASNIEDTPIGITTVISGVDLNGNKDTISIDIRGLVVGNGLDKDGTVNVTTSDGTVVEITLDASLTNKIATSTDATTSKSEVQLSGEILDAVLAQLATKRPSYELQGSYGVDSVTVTTKGADDTTKDVEVSANDLAITDKSPETKKENVDTPVFIITPEDAYITTGVVVDGTKVSIPSVEKINDIISNNTGTDNGDGTTTYTATGTNGDRISITVDTSDTSNIKDIHVQPNGITDYDVIFNMDSTDNTAGATPNEHINNTKYGEALVSWNKPDVDAHIIEGIFKKKEITVEGSSITGGSISPDKTTISYGDSAHITLKPEENMVIEPTKEITINSNGTTIVGTLDELAKNTGLEVDIRKDKDGSITSVEITVKDNHENVHVSAEDGLFRSNQPSDLIQDLLQPVIDKLQDKVAVVDAIIEQEEDSPYVVGDQQYNDMVKENTTAKDILDKLTKEDGTLIDKIKDAKTEKEMMDAILEALGEESNVNSITDVQQRIEDTSNALQAAIENLNAKDETKRKEQIVVTLPNNVGIAPDATGINDSVKPTINVLDKSTSQTIGNSSSIVTDGKQNLVIQPVQTQPGNKVTEITMSIKDPVSGEERNVSIPVIPTKDNNTLEITVTDHEGSTKTETISSAGIYPMLTTKDGQSSIALPGNILDDIFKAGFGNDVVAGIVNKITISKTEAKTEINPNKDSITNDGGIKETPIPTLKTNETKDDGSTTINNSDSNNKIDLTNEGITVENIQTKDDYALKGITVTVVGTDDQQHQIFIPSTDKNTTDNSSSSGKDINITNEALQEAIKQQVNDSSIDLADFDVIDVTVTTTAPLTSKETAINKSEAVTGMILDTKDTDGNKVSIIVPVDGNEKPDKVTVQYQKDGKLETQEITLRDIVGEITSTTNPDGKAVVNISGTMVEDILHQIADSASISLDSKEIVVSKEDLLKERVANELPEEISAGKGILSKIDKSTSLSGSDKDGTNGETADNYLLEGDEHLFISNIAPSTGYRFDGVTLTVKGINDEKLQIEKQIEIVVAANGDTKAIIDGKEIVMPKNSLNATQPSDSAYGSLDLSQAALEAIYNAVKLQKNPNGIYEADITDISVNAVLTDKNAIAMPDALDEKNSHNLDPNTKVEIAVTPSVVLPDITINKNVTTSIVQIPVTDANGTSVNVKVDYTDPENPHAYVETASGLSTVEVALSDKAKDSIQAQGDQINKIPGDVLQDIIHSYNDIAIKDVDKSGSENLDTTPLQFPQVSVEEVKDSSGNKLDADISGGTFVEGALSGNEDIIISPVKVKPAHQLEDVVVTTKDKNGNEITIRVPVAPNPNSELDTVTVAVKDKDSDKTYEYNIPTEQLDKVTVVEGDGKEITLPGALITDILEKTVEQDKSNRPSSNLVSEATVTSVAVDAVRNGIHVPDIADVKGDDSSTSANVSIISRKDEKISDEPILLPKTTDILIENIVHEEGYRPDEIVLTMRNDAGKEIQVNLPVPGTEGVINAILPDGTTMKLPIKSDTHPDGIDLSGLTLKEDTTDEIRIPGKALESIMEKLSDSDVADMDIVSINIHESQSTWELPLSEEIVKSSNDSVSSLKDVEEVHSVVLKGEGKVESSLDPTDKKLFVDKNGSFTMLVAYGNDDYHTVNPNSHNFPHEYDGLKVNGISLSKKQLEGIVQSHMDGSLEIDTAKLSAKVSELSGVPFEGFNDIQIQTIPTNPQYKTFKNEYLGLDSMNTNSTEYEALVEKLLSQFDTNSTNPDVLSKDNMSHLIDYKADLEARVEKIEQQKKINDLSQRIKDAYEAMDKAIDAVDGTKEGLPFDYSDTETINKDVIKEVEKFRGQVEALEKEVLALDKDSKDAVIAKIPGKSGEANKLDQMLDAIETVDVKTLGKVGVVNELLNEILSTSPVDIIDDAQDSTNPDSYDVAKGKVEQLDEISNKINRINTMLSSMTEEELKEVSSSKRKELNELQAKVQDEYTDFANIFTKEYLTWDNKAYIPGSDGTSSNSSNGYTQDLFVTKGEETKLAVMDAKKEFGKLSEQSQKAIGLPDETIQKGVFYGPTLNELFDSIVDSVNAVDVLVDVIDEHYEKLSSKATSQQEKDDLGKIRDDAVKNLQDGKDKKQENFAGDSLNSIVQPVKDSLGNIVYENLERRAEAIDATISFIPKGSSDSVTKEVHIEYREDGSVRAITSDGIEMNALTPEQLAGLKQTVPNNPPMGSIHINGEILEELLGIKDASDKKIDKVDISFASLTVDELTKISDDAITKMDAVVKEHASQEIENEVQAVKEKVKDILGTEINTQLDELLEASKQIIKNADAKDVHDLVNTQLEQMENILISEIKKELSTQFAKNAQDVSTVGYEKLEDVYTETLEKMSGSEITLDEALDLFNTAKKEMETIHADNPEVEEKPDPGKPDPDPESPDPGKPDPDPENPDPGKPDPDPENPDPGKPDPNPESPEKPEENTGNHDPIKPYYPSGSTQTVSRPGSSNPKFEIIFDETTDTLANRSELQTFKKKLKDEYNRIESSYVAYKELDGYDKLINRLNAVYNQAIEKLDLAKPEERQGIVNTALNEMANIEVEFKELKKENKNVSFNKGKQDKKVTASWFNLLAILVLLAGAVYGLLKRHRFLAVLTIDFLSGVLLILLTQGITLQNLTLFNSYSILFVLLGIIDAGLLFVFRDKKEETDKISRS